MVIVMIRRCVKLGKEAEFLESYKNDSPVGKPGFIVERLGRVNTSNALPEALRNFPISKPDCLTYVNVACWESAAAFADAFSPQVGFYDETIETEARVRVILDVLGGH